MHLSIRLRLPGTYPHAIVDRAYLCLQYMLSRLLCDVCGPSKGEPRKTIDPLSYHRTRHRWPALKGSYVYTLLLAICRFACPCSVSMNVNLHGVPNQDAITACSCIKGAVYARQRLYALD